MSAISALVIAEPGETREMLERALREGGAVPQSVPPSELAAAPASRMAVCAWDGQSDLLERAAARLRPDAQLIAVVPPVELGLFTRALALQSCNHVLYADAAASSWLSVTVRKFVSGDLFGIEKYLPPDAPVQLVRLRSFEERERAIAQILEEAGEAGVRTRTIGRIEQVCAELLMNALYDAPVDENGRMLFADVEGGARLASVSPRPVSIRSAATSEGFAVSVRDRYGRLDKATILRFLDKCLRSPDQIDRKTYGAGLGLYLIANSATQMVVNVAPGMATEVVCWFDRGVRTGLRMLSVFRHPGTSTGA